MHKHPHGFAGLSHCPVFSQLDRARSAVTRLKTNILDADALEGLVMACSLAWSQKTSDGSISAETHREFEAIKLQVKSMLLTMSRLKAMGVEV